MRRRTLLTLPPALALAACASGPPPLVVVPIVFVHGNGDSAALWQTTIWRFESNGWPRDRLAAIDLPYPLARDEDDRPQPGRSSTADHLRAIATAMEQALQRSGADKAVLVGHSRGANAIRNYVANGGGSQTVAAAVLAGGTSHGVWNDPSYLPGSEFNGASPFLRALNTPRESGDDEVPLGIRWLTIRSDSDDKFAQPDGAWIGRKGWPTHIGFDAPALKGASNAVLPGRDHRELAFHADAFALMWSFIAQRPPASPDLLREDRVVLDGVVSGFGLDNDPARGTFPTNLPLIGATVEVHAVDAETGERRGAPLLQANPGASGRWGPLATDSPTHLEFVVAAPGYATTHIYRSPFPRSSGIVHLRAERLPAAAEAGASSSITLSRPRGYFGVPRDRIELDGLQPPPGLQNGVPGASSAMVQLRGSARRVAGEFNGERIVGRAWPLADGHVTVLELHS